MDFFHHPEGLISIKHDDGREYRASIDVFDDDLTVLGLAPYRREAGVKARRYRDEPGTGRRIHSAWRGDNQAGGIEPWLDADNWFSMFDALYARFDARENPPMTLEKARTIKKTEINQESEMRLATGFDHLGATYQADVLSILNMTAVTASIAAGKGLPRARSSIDWWDASNVPHAMTPAAFLDFAAAARDYVATTRATARALKDQVAAAATIAEVEAISWPVSWPV